MTPRRAAGIVLASCMAAAGCFGAGRGAVRPATPSVDGVKACLERQRQARTNTERDRLARECFRDAQALLGHDRSLAAKAQFVLALSARYWGTPEHRGRLENSFEGLLKEAVAPDVLARSDAAGLSDLFAAFNEVAFYTKNARHVAALEEVFGELERRKAQSADQVLDLYEREVAAREFDKARSLILRHPHPEAERLPEIIIRDAVKQPGPKVYEVSGDGGTMRLAPVDLAGRPTIIAIIGCHFAKDALAAIEADPQLRRVFEAHSRLVLPQGSLGIDDVVAWNEDHRTWAMAMVHREEDWPLIDDWSRIPTFYFLAGDKVVFKAVGKPWNELREDILKGMRLAGIAE
ncbi:MAG: hypothetical protein HY748_01250 [Elusimicrobia bacterium]|nr:hypothetical protein [Elusimicrobiota bacterium]